MGDEFSLSLELLITARRYTTTVLYFFFFFFHSFFFSESLISVFFVRSFYDVVRPTPVIKK